IADMAEGRKKIVKNIQNSIWESIQTTPTMGVGGLVHTLENMNRSYIEAIATMDYTFSSPKGSIIYFEEISVQQKNSFGYPQEDQIKFIHSLKQGDQAVAEEALKGMFRKLKENKMSVYQLKCICFDIINALLKTSAELGVTDKIGDLKQLTNFSTLDQLEKRILHSSKDICEYVEKKRECDNQYLRTEILT